MNTEIPVISKFSNNYQDIIQTYCDNINRCNADLFIVMARKGVCFFDLLMDDGLICLSHNQKVISSNALDFKPSISPNSKIAVTDDIMISGTSISSIVNALLDIGVAEENIAIIVLAVDSENMKLSFTTESRIDMLHKGWSMPNADCIELSSQISNALSIFGRPYDVDFPVYNPVIVSKSDLSNLLNPNFWNIYNLTNPHQASSQIDAITLIPTQRASKMIWSRFGFKTVPFAHVKIRLYIKNIDDNSVSLQLVPFVLFYEIGYAQIDELCLGLAGTVFSDFEYTAKLRVCQFILCHKLASFFSSISQCDISLSFHNSVLTSLFGYDFANYVLNLINSKTASCECIDFQYVEAPLDLLDYSEDESNSILDSVQKLPFHNISNDGRELNIQLLQPFISWYLTRELPTRKELAKNRHNFRLDRKYIQEKTYRLDSGYSFRALNTIFADSQNCYRWPDTISIFLDRAIDMGVIVPIMFNNSFTGTVCRAFRHGEDLPFGVADKSRVLFFLQQLQKQFKAKGCEGIAHVSLEKIVVLFIQMSLRDKGVFNQFLGFRNSEVLSIRYSVHGAIATTIFPNADIPSLKYYFDAAPYWDWITNYLFKKGMIEQRSSTKNNPNQYICADAFDEYEEQFNNICNEIQVKIKKYASIFAEWYGAMHLRQRDEFKDQVIQLSTCFSVPAAAAALATELHYFYRYWIEEVQVGFQKYLERTNHDSPLQIPGMDATKVLNSAQEKYEWFEKKSYIKAISDVKKLLDAKNPYLSADWEGRWHPVVSSIRHYDPKLITRYYECYCYILICCACYELLSGGEMADKGKEHIESDAFAKIQSYREQFMRIKEKHELQMDDFDELFSFVTIDNFKLNNVEDRIQVLCRHMDRLLKYANIVVEDIQSLVSEQSLDTSVYFSNCIIVELQCSDEEKCDSIVEDTWNLLANDEHKTLINIFKLKSNVNKENYQRYGFFYAYNEDISTKMPFPMDQIIRYIHTRAETNCINNRFVVVPQLPSICRLRYSYKTNMQNGIDRFNQIVCDQVVPYFSNKKSSQIILVQKPDDSYSDSLDLIAGFTREPPVVLGYEKLNWQTLVDYSLIHCKSDCKSFPRLSTQDSGKNSVASLSYFDIDEKRVTDLVGTATVCSYKGIIIALTCMHCLSDDVEQIYAVKLKTYGYHTLYGKPASGNPDHQENAPAEQEVAVLLLYWDPECTERAYFEPGVILDMSSEYISSTTTSLSCFGYPSERGVTVRAIQYYEANDGYLEFIIADNENFKSGFSGALFFDEEQNPFAIAYSWQGNGKTHAYGIPMPLAVARAQEIVDNGE